MNHTPGPWHLVETEPGIDAEMDVFTMAPRYAGGTALVARVMHADDALVIAAAPELLAALQMVARIWSHDQTANAAPDSPLAIVRAAIDKAIGEQTP